MRFDNILKITDQKGKNLKIKNFNLLHCTIPAHILQLLGNNKLLLVLFIEFLPSGILNRFNIVHDGIVTVVYVIIIVMV